MIKLALVSALTGLMAVGPAALARAGPEGASVQTGDVSITQTAPTDWEIRASDGSIIHYDRFDIAADQWVRFVQDNAESRVLNRVFSENPTQILGRLSANGHVYLVNPAGVFIGDGARVDANGFHAAAGRISDEDFLARREKFTDLKGAVTNRGVISGADVELSDDGASVVALAGRQVTNEALSVLLGRIFVDGEQGFIVLAAGTDVLITSTGDSFAVQIEGALAAPGELQLQNNGTLDAKRGRVGLAAGDMAGLALFHTSVTQPDGSVDENRVAGNRILVQGGDDSVVSVAGTLDASSTTGAGGKIDVSGTRVAVQDADLLASGSTAGGSVSLSARDGGIGSRLHTEAELSVEDTTSIDVSVIDVPGADGDGGSIALATEGALDYRATDTNLDGQGDDRAPGVFSVKATELIVNGSAAAGQAAISSALLAAQGGEQGASLVLEGTDALRLAAAADLSAAQRGVELRGAVDTSAAAVIAEGDLGVVGGALALGDLTSKTGDIAIDGSGDVSLQGTLAAHEGAGEVEIDAGTGSTGTAQVNLGSGVAFEATRVAITQDADASIGSVAPGGVAAGDLAAIAARAPGSLDYELRSREGSVELRSEGGGAINLVARAKRDISVADDGSKLEARSVDLGVDGAWQPGFDVDVTGLAALRSGLAGAGDLNVNRSIDAAAITLAAGNGTSTSADPDGAAVVIGPLAVLGVQPLDGFRLEQDMSIAQPSQLGAIALADGASYELVSRLGGVSVDASQLDKVSGERVTLESRKGISLDFASGPRELGEANPLGSLALRSGDSHTVDYKVFASGSGSRIDLAAGVQRDAGDAISGDLTLTKDAELYAEHIALAAGDGQPNSGAISGRVIIDPLTQFGRAAVTSGTPLAPKSFSLEQDELLGGPTRPLPTREQLGTLSGVGGEDNVTLRARLGSLTLDSAAVALLQGTNAVLGAFPTPPGFEDETSLGVRLTAEKLDVKSLKVESDLIVDRSNTGGTDGQVDVISAGDIRLDGATPDVAGTRGNLLVRSTAKLNVDAGGDVFAGRIQSTSSPGSTPATGFDAPETDFELQLAAQNMDVTEIQAGGTTDRDGGDVKIEATGNATFGSISADAGQILASDGDLDGGTVSVSASNLTVGNVLARGGVFSSGSTPSNADGGKVRLALLPGGGLIDLVGSRYDTREPTGKGGVLELRGDLQLAPPVGSTGAPVVSFSVGDLLATSVFRISQALSNNAQVAALVDASGAIDLQAGADLGAGSLLLGAGSDIGLGGGVAADSLIQLFVDSDGSGGGHFLPGNPIALASREIRLGAGDANSTTSDGALLAGDLARFTLFGEGGAGNPLRFQLVQDRAVDLDGEGTLIAADRFGGGIDGMKDMKYAVVSRRAGVALSNAAVKDTHLSVSVAGTTGAASTATPDAANGDVTVAGGSLDVASAEISADRDLRVGFGISTPGGDGSKIRLFSGQTARGDLSVSGTLRADEIALVAGRVGLSESLVKLDPAARFLRGTDQDQDPDPAPRSFTFEQDASITETTELPDLAVFFPALGLDGMSYSLASHAGDVTLSNAARVAGTQLSVTAQNVAIRSALQVANLDVFAIGGISVEAGVTAAGNRPASDAKGTWAPSHIRLQAGGTGANRNLEIGAVALAADEIALRTGAGSFDSAAGGGSRVSFADGASLGGLDGSRLERLELEQEASFGANGSAIPTGFIDDPDDLAGLDLVLISNSGEIAVASAAQAPLQGMALALHGARGVTLESGGAGGLSYGSLLARVGTTAENSALPSISLQDSVRTERGELNLLGDVRMSGAGERGLVARGGTGLVDGVVKVTGTLSRADGPVDGTIGSLAVEADDEVSISAVDLSGSDARRHAGSVQIASLAGLAEVGSVRSVGGRTGDQGGDGGNVEIDGKVVRVGSVDTGAEFGNAGSVSLGTGPTPPIDRVPGTERVEVGGDLSLVGQKPSDGSIGQGGRLRVGAPLALRSGGGLIDAGAIELPGGVRLAGSGGVTGTGTEALRATARGKLTAGGDLVASEVALVGLGASGDLDLGNVEQVLADRISLEAGEGGADILLPQDIAFRDLAGEDHPDAFRVTQDAALDFGGGANELVARDNLVDPGGTLAGMELALESRQNQVRVVDPAQVAATRLTLRGAGATAVQVDGDLDVERLTLGSGLARIDGELEVDGALASAGNVEVSGVRAAVGGPVLLTANEDEQVVRVGGGAGTLALGGDLLRQRTSGKGDLRLDARRIEFTSIRDQSIAARGGVASDAPAGTLPEGKLVITAADPLVKAGGGLALEADSGIDLSGIAGQAPDGSQRNVVETLAGPLALRTRSGTTALRGGLAAGGGDLVADTNLDFRGAAGETALRATGSVSALQGAQVDGEEQDLVLASGSGSVHTGGVFAISDGSFLPDSDLVVERDTSIQAKKVLLHGATGAGDLAVRSGGLIGVDGDVNLDPSSSLELSGSSVQLTKTGAQSLSAGSLALTRSDAGASGVLVEHFGNLSLGASSGGLTTSAGAQLVATGDLTLLAASGISLGDSVAANTVTLFSDSVSVGSNASVEANRITSSGEGSGVFATPTGTEVSSELVNDRAVLRSLPGELTQEDLLGFIEGEDGILPPTGPALGDASDEAAIWQTAPAILATPVGPRAAALATRPLWPDEVLAFLRRDPQARGGLPDVAAGDALTAPLHERLRTPDAERAASIYRDLFRPGPAADPDAAIARVAELRALFESAAEDERARGPLDASALMRSIAGDPAHARALAVARRAADMLDSIRSLGLTPGDYAELRTRLVGPLAPRGIEAAAFAKALESI